jgi:hypothetical protein
VKLELDRPPLEDPGWRHTLAPAAPTPAPGYSYAVELGDHGKLTDGLVGYFEGDDHSVFNAVVGAGEHGTTGFVRTIGDDNHLSLTFAPESSATITLLVDPRATVHATTDVLPVATLTLPAPYVAEALAAVQVAFRAGPVLTERDPAAADPAVADLLLPPPAAGARRWAWAERSGVDWTTLGVKPPDTAAHLSDTPPVLRTGLLKLDAAFTDAAGGRKEPA